MLELGSSDAVLELGSSENEQGADPTADGAIGRSSRGPNSGDVKEHVWRGPAAWRGLAGDDAVRSGCQRGEMRLVASRWGRAAGVARSGWRRRGKDGDASG